MPVAEVHAPVGISRRCAITKAAQMAMIVATTMAPTRKVSTARHLPASSDRPSRLADEQVAQRPVGELAAELEGGDGEGDRTEQDSGLGEPLAQPRGVGQLGQGEVPWASGRCRAPAIVTIVVRTTTRLMAP